MTFPSRGCRTCKKRRIKCDEAQPVCKRCQKANATCHRTQESGNFIFLNENEYAVGQRKRPRGPNTTSRQGKESHVELVKPDGPLASVKSNNDNPFLAPLIFSISPTLSVSLEDQAISYYSTYYCEVPHGWPEIVDSHIIFALANFQPQSQSILNFAIYAVSHATFGRARRSQAVLATGSTQYSKALAKINVALRDPSLATHDEVLLAAMLLSFYENSVTQKRSPIANRDLQFVTARSFTHHDGAMALLKLRRQLKQRTDWGMKVDKLTRRQLLRSLLLRSLPIPGWLRDGSLFGEYGLALKMDRYIVIAAKLRHQASNLRISTNFPLSGSEDVENLRYLLAEAQKLDDVLAMWADEVPREDWYGSLTVKESGQGEPGNRIFCETVHVYPTVGHAGLWNRYRGVRLVVNDAMLKTLNVLARASEPGTESVEEAARSRIKLLAEDLCASLPYVLGLLVGQYPVGSGFVVAKTPASLKMVVKASKASLLCWPLTITTMVDAIPERHRRYLKARLLDVSELVDDGLLERVATA